MPRTKGNRVVKARAIVAKLPNDPKITFQIEIKINDNPSEFYWYSHHVLLTPTYKAAVRPTVSKRWLPLAEQAVKKPGVWVIPNATGE